MKTNDEIKDACKEKGWKIKQASFDGMFVCDPKKKRTIIVSWGAGWEHVSINDWNTTPTWEEMCELKDVFWKESECVIQYHPPKSEYVNNLQHCLHLWRPIEQFVGKLPIPDSLLVGIKGLEFEK